MGAEVPGPSGPRPSTVVCSKIRTPARSQAARRPQASRAGLTRAHESGSQSPARNPGEWISDCSSSRSRKTGSIPSCRLWASASRSHATWWGSVATSSSPVRSKPQSIPSSATADLDGVEILSAELLEGPDLVREALDAVAEAVGEAGGAEAAVASRGSPAATVALQDHHVDRRVVALGQQCRPQPGVAAAHHHQIGRDRPRPGAVPAPARRGRPARTTAGRRRQRPRRGPWGHATGQGGGPDRGLGLRMDLHNHAQYRIDLQNVGSDQKVGIVGASGYGGAELLRLCAGHPDLQVAVATAGSNAGAGGGRPHARRWRPPTPTWSTDPPKPTPWTGSTWSSSPCPTGSPSTWCPISSTGWGSSSTWPPTSASATRRCTRPGTARCIWRPNCSTRSSTACPSSTATELLGATRIAAPGCYPTAALLALAPLVEAGALNCRRTGHRH